MARVRNFWCHLLNFEPQVKRTYYNVSSLLFFLELKLLMPPLCLAFFRDARMASLYFVAFPHCFLCSGGEFWWFFSSAPWALCQLSPSPRVLCCVVLFPLPGPVCWQSFGFPHGCLWSLWGREHSLPAATIEPVLASYHVALYTCFPSFGCGSWPCCRNPEAFLAGHSVVAAGVGISQAPKTLRTRQWLFDLDLRSSQSTKKPLQKICKGKIPISPGSCFRS